MQRVLTCGFTAQFSIIIEAITAESNGITHYKKRRQNPSALKDRVCVTTEHATDFVLNC